MVAVLLSLLSGRLRPNRLNGRCLAVPLVRETKTNRLTNRCLAVPLVRGLRPTVSLDTVLLSLLSGRLRPNRLNGRCLAVPLVRETKTNRLTNRCLAVPLVRETKTKPFEWSLSCCPSCQGD